MSMGVTPFVNGLTEEQRELRNTVKNWIALAGIVSILLLPSAALAQDSVVDGYNNGGGGTQGQAERGAVKGEGAGGAGEAGAAADLGTTEAGALPFTGLDIGFVAIGGLVLIVAGAGMAWLARPRPTI